MKINLALLAVGFVLVGAHRSSAQSSEAIGPGPLAPLTISAIKDVVEAGSPVDLKVTVKNISDHLAIYPTWGSQGDTKFDVRDSAGNQPLTRRGRVLLLGEGRSDDDFIGGSQAGAGVEPGKTITVKERIPAHIYDLTKPGTYSIRIHKEILGQMLTSNTVTVTVVQGATPYTAPAPQPPISVTIETLGGASVSSGGTVALGVVTKNISNHFTNERTAQDRRDLTRFYRTDVHDSQGGVPPETQFGQASGNRGNAPPQWLGLNPPPPGRDDLEGNYKPGQQRTQVISVNDLYDLSQPGQYTIQVRRWDDETKTWVKSNTITVTVTP